MKNLATIIDNEDIVTKEYVDNAASGGGVITSTYDSNTKTVTLTMGGTPSGVNITQDSTTGILTIV